jgi:predicted nucleotidyltransferase
MRAADENRCGKSSFYMLTKKTIKDFALRVARQFNPEKIILFGSYAYGKPGNDSDLDLLVVLRHQGSAIKKASDIRLALPADVPVDVIVRTPERIQERLAINDFFMREIIERGQVLYAASNNGMGRKSRG